METLGKAVGTFAVWIGVAVLSHMFNSYGILNGNGAFGLVVAGLFATGVIWGKDIL